MRKVQRRKLMVSEDAILDFAASSVGDRLKWLDEMRDFLSKTLPPRTKKIYDELRGRR